MSILARPICYLVGHRRARRRVWHDRLDLRAPCIRCATPLIRSYDKGWRPFLPSDATPERISRDSYREQLQRENDSGRGDERQPDIWARQLITTFGNAKRMLAEDHATLFDRLLADLANDPAFVAAAAAGQLDPDARAAIGRACMEHFGSAKPLPGHALDPLAKYLLARAAASGGTPMPMGIAASRAS